MYLMAILEIFYVRYVHVAHLLGFRPWLCGRLHASSFKVQVKRFDVKDAAGTMLLALSTI